MAEAVRGLSPVTDKEVKIRREEEVISVRNERTEPGLNEIAAPKRSIIACRNLSKFNFFGGSSSTIIDRF